MQRQSGVFREYEAVFRSLQWMLLACLTIWCGTLLFLTYSVKDWPLIGLLFIAITCYCIGYAVHPSRDALTLLAGMTLGKGGNFVLREDCGWRMEDGKSKPAILHPPSSILIFLTGLVVLLTFASWWHLDMSESYYKGPRWMGLWDNPNIYGMLMGAGGTLAIGLLAANAKFKIQNVKTNWILGIAVFMLGVGLVMSYSRGAWLGTGMGLLYLAWSYGKLKWRHIILGAGVLALASGVFWGRTSDSAPWYVKRADLGRPSAQNRATAWRAGLAIMRDHPLGVGWNQAVNIYREKYSPTEGGPGALTTNDYLMLGTELGIPALLCFVVYVGLCFGGRPHLVATDVRRLHLKSAESEPPHVGCYSLAGATPGGTSGEPADETSALRCACRAGAVVLLVAFWFDGGLFNLPTAAVFWVLLELGVERTESRNQSHESGKRESGKRKIEASRILSRERTQGTHRCRLLSPPLSSFGEARAEFFAVFALFCGNKIGNRKSAIGN